MPSRRHDSRHPAFKLKRRFDRRSVISLVRHLVFNWTSRHGPFSKEWDPSQKEWLLVGVWQVAWFRYFFPLRPLAIASVALSLSFVSSSGETFSNTVVYTNSLSSCGFRPWSISFLPLLMGKMSAHSCPLVLDSALQSFSSGELESRTSPYCSSACLLFGLCV